MKARIYKFDNLKPILMILVIIAHTLINSYGNVTQEIIRFLCLCYTMPLFTFISGYLSKSDYKLKDLARSLLLPYLVFSTLNHFVMSACNSNYKIDWLQPGFAMWYLWVLFAFRLVLPYVLRIKYVLPISIIAAVLVGFFPLIGPKIGLSRLICFFPYFIIGYKIGHPSNSKWEKINSKLILQKASGGGNLLFCC